MTTEEQAKVIETNGMMEAIGWKLVNTEEKPEGIYVTYVLSRKIEAAKISPAGEIIATPE